MEIIFLFTILTIINIILQTMHSVCLVRCTKIIASVVNAVAFAVYTIVIVYTSSDQITLLTKVIIVGVCNLIGTYISLLILEKIRKDKLWKIETTIKCDNVNALEINIPHTILLIENNTYLITFYCATQKQTLIAKAFINEHNGKYFVSENHCHL